MWLASGNADRAFSLKFALDQQPPSSSSSTIIFSSTLFIGTNDIPHHAFSTTRLPAPFATAYEMAAHTTGTIYSLSQETIALVYAYVIADQGILKSPWKTLHSLACTCHFLSEPAVDLIWHTLPSIWRLLLLLPDDAYTLHHIAPVDVKTPSEDEKRFHCVDPRVQYAFRRELTPDDFKRWTEYSSRIRRIDCSLPLSPRASLRRRPQQLLAPEVYAMLQTHCPKPHLPNLTSLAFNESAFIDGEGVNLPASFHSSSSLKAVVLYPNIHPDTSHLPDVVEYLSLLSPQVQTLELAGDRVDFTETNQNHLSGWSVAANRLSCLTDFEGEGVAVALDALLGLGRLPHLRRVSIQPRTVRRDWAPHGRRDGCFAALEVLKLDGTEGNTECCIDFLAAITPTSLRFVSLELRWRDIPDDTAEARFRALSTALGGLPCCGTVKTILPWPDQKIPDDWYDVEVAEYSYCPPGPDVPDRPRATLAGFLSLVQRCPDLAVLVVPVNMRVVPNFDGLTRPPVSLARPSKVDTLHTEGCAPGDPLAVASFLSLVLPGLTRFELSIPFCQWKEMGQWYYKFCQLRRRERRWGLESGKALEDPVDLSTVRVRD
ncbi:hypothetical protein C2E23DRAFT_890010 [Lenzites betulinus]|nr:hypothetical protein C2E23DRAFT_890010 [Lenzites betulinus]